MENSCSLENKKCAPCEGGVPPLEGKAIHDFLMQLKSDWMINKAGHLYQRYTFENFMQAMEFANKIAVLAEEEGHHPDLSISWGSCGVEIWTHKIDGLTESDFILAAKIEGLL